VAVTVALVPIVVTFTAGVASAATAVSQLDTGANPSNTFVSVSPTTVVYHTGVTYSVSVSPDGPEGGEPGGTVVVTTGSTALCSATVSSGDVSTCVASNAPVGTDTITATYSGSSKFAASSGTTTLTVTATSPTDPIAANFKVLPCDGDHPYAGSGDPLVLGSAMAPGVPNADVYSNYVDGTCAVTPCDGQEGCIPGKFGLKYQCTELAVRWAYEYGRVGTSAGSAWGDWTTAGWSTGAAYQMFTVAPKLGGMTAAPNGRKAGLAPQPGDLIVWNQTSTDGAGHVALVVKVTSTSLSFVGENQGTNTKVTVPYSPGMNVVSNDGFLSGTPLHPNGTDAKYYVEGWIQFDNGV
jgi:hypothetical protein